MFRVSSMSSSSSSSVLLMWWCIIMAVNTGALTEAITDTALIDAARAGDLAEVRRLAAEENCRDVNKPHGVSKQTPLMVAADKDHLAVVQYLLACGADPNMKDINGWTAVMAAAERASVEVMHAVLAAHPDLDLQDDYGWTALFFASAFHNLANVKELLEAGSNTDIQDSDGKTALIMHIVATSSSDMNITLALLDSGANMDLQDNRGWTALYIANRYNQTEQVAALLNYGANTTITANPTTTATTNKGSVPILVTILEYLFSFYNKICSDLDKIYQ